MRTRACEGSSHAQQLPLYDIWLKNKATKLNYIMGCCCLLLKTISCIFLRKLIWPRGTFHFFLLYFLWREGGKLSWQKTLFEHFFFFEIMTSSCSIFFKLWHQLTFRHWKGGKTAKSWIVGSLVSHITALKWEK